MRTTKRIFKGIHPGQTLPESQNKGIWSPMNRTYVLQNCLSLGQLVISLQFTEKNGKQEDRVIRNYLSHPRIIKTTTDYPC